MISTLNLSKPPISSISAIISKKVIRNLIWKQLKKYTEKREIDEIPSKLEKEKKKKMKREIHWNQKLCERGWIFWDLDRGCNHLDIPILTTLD